MPELTFRPPTQSRPHRRLVTEQPRECSSSPAASRRPPAHLEKATCASFSTGHSDDTYRPEARACPGRALGYVGADLRWDRQEVPAGLAGWTQSRAVNL